MKRQQGDLTKFSQFGMQDENIRGCTCHWIDYLLIHIVVTLTWFMFSGMTKKKLYYFFVLYLLFFFSIYIYIFFIFCFFFYIYFLFAIQMLKLCPNKNPPHTANIIHKSQNEARRCSFSYCLNDDLKVGKMCEGLNVKLTQRY